MRRPSASKQGSREEAAVPTDSIAAFIIANTRLVSPPLVPEVRLHLATEDLPIWKKGEDELEAAGIRAPYWAFAWAGGQALARYVLDHPEIVRNRSVLDLGAGSGLSAIAARLAGAADVLAADIDPFAAMATNLNASANGLTVRTTTEDFLTGTLPGGTDVVLAGDVFYDKGLAQTALQVCRAAAANGCAILAGDPQRAYFPCEAFEKVAQYSVPVTRELEDFEIKRTAVWRLTKF